MTITWIDDQFGMKGTATGRVDGFEGMFFYLDTGLDTFVRIDAQLPPWTARQFRGGDMEDAKARCQLILEETMKTFRDYLRNPLWEEFLRS